MDESPTLVQLRKMDREDLETGSKIRYLGPVLGALGIAAEAMVTQGLTDEQCHFQLDFALGLARHDAKKGDICDLK